MSGVARVLGIDFSGDAAQWTPTRASNVWIADLRRRRRGLVLAALRPVQALPGAGLPFDRLAALLATGDFAAAGIDAPCGLPAPFAGADHAALLARVAALPRGARPFPRGETLVRAVAGRPPPLSPAKPLREAERRWTARGVNVRSALWLAPRGGAPMTAACLTLLARAGRPVWPFQPAGPGCLAEVFPAAQLRAWGLPHVRYDGPEGAPVRRIIAGALASRVELGPFAAVVLARADPLDAVLAAFGALALAEGRLESEPGTSAAVEGWIAVHA